MLREACKRVWFGVLGQLGRWRPAAGVPIVTYHSIDASGSPISKSPDAFEHEMRWLKRHGFETLSLTRLIERFQSGGLIAPRTIVLTFDDGFASVHTTAFPLLCELGFTATVFVVTDFVGERTTWEVSPRVKAAGTDWLPLMSWSQLGEWTAAGCEVGSHTARHLRLAALNIREARDEIDRSLQAIADQLGVPCRTLSYPYGVVDDRLRSLLAASELHGAVTVRFGRATATDDPFRLPRVGSARFTNRQVFQACIHGSYGWFRQVRSTA